VRRRRAGRAGATLATLVVVLATAATLAADPEATAIDAIFADLDRTDSPGCSLGVIRDGDLAYKRGYGMANLEHGLALTPRSVFRIGSTSKQFTAMTVLLLARDGKLDLDADIRTYLPELRAYDAPVTTRQLVHHTSGYRDYLTLMSLAGMREDDWATDAQVLDLLARQNELNFAPGTEHLYSNSGYFLLSQIVRAAGGKSLREIAAERIFAPLGMASTHFHDDHTHVVPHRATGYSPLDDDGYRIHTTTLDMVGDGGVFTSVEDLLRWDRNFYENRLGDASLLEEYLTPGVLADGEPLRYAFGLTIREHRGLRKVSHGGAFVGYRAEMIRFPDERLSVICLCNRSDGQPSRRAQEVADLYLADRLAAEEVAAKDETAGQADTVDIPVARLKRYAGGYERRDAGTIVRIESEDAGLVYVFSNGRHAMTPIAEGEFRLEDVPLRVTLSFEAAATESGRTVLRVDIEGRDEPLVYDPVELVRPGAEELAVYAATYGCEELDTTLRVWSEDGELYAAHTDPFKDSPDDPLDPTVVDRFERSPLMLEFARDDRGGVTGLRLSAGRVRNLVCDRLPSAQ
jgi:CubicO group peptidase (beta-lactamase class C family)